MTYTMSKTEEKIENIYKSLTTSSCNCDDDDDDDDDATLSKVSFYCSLWLGIFWVREM